MTKTLKTVLISAFCALLGGVLVAFAAQNNYLGVVFVADTTSPANQLKVNADGSINAKVSGAALVQKLGQSTLPFVLLPSGSFGNNGAWTTTNAAQPTAYPNAYCFVPANAIASGSAAGWYYCTFSGTQAATLFNNTYTSGTPTIPASPTAFVTTGPGAYTQSTSAQTAYVLAIAGNTLGTNGAVSVQSSISSPGTTSTKTVTATYGNFTFANAQASVLTSTVKSVGLFTGFTNRAATNVQVPLSNFFGTVGSGLTNPLSYGSVDSTVSQNLSITMQLASANDSLVLESAVVELLPGVP